MADLLLRDLVAATGGSVAYAAMPPRDGEFVMLRNSTAVAPEVRYGDLYWALRGLAGDGMQHVEEAFARGAAGAVICGRAIEPWPGKFTVTVDDVGRALCHAASLARARFGGMVVAVTAGANVAALIQRVLGARLPGSFAGFSAHALAADAAALGLMNAHPSHEYLVAEIGATDREIAAQRCCPHVLVATESGQGKEIVRLLDALPDDGWAVLNGDDAELRATVAETGTRGLRITWVGQTAGCDVRAVDVKQGARGSRCVVEGTALRVPATAREQLPAVLATWAVGRILQISDLSISKALGSFPTAAGDRAASATLKVVGMLGEANFPLTATHSTNH